MELEGEGEGVRKKERGKAWKQLSGKAPLAWYAGGSGSTGGRKRKGKEEGRKGEKEGGERREERGRREGGKYQNYKA